MCGINGFNFKDPDLLERMTRITSHRGPDQNSMWSDEHMSFGHNRLAIIDLSPKGSQPMWDAARELVITFNGEIYNFKELRKELEKMYSFQSESDTEVILYAYKKYGYHCVKKLNGIFAFAIWDTKKQELFIARDQMGVKPLYYYQKDTRVIFSSEIKAILECHEVPRAVDRDAFSFYTSILYIPEPYTMFQGIKKFPAAHYAVIRKGKIEMQKYWEVTDFSDIQNYTEAKENIHHIFTDAVQRQLISDRPVGVFLSGGIDSTAILGAVSEFHKGRVKTFSVGFKESNDPKKFNTDFNLARKTAAFYGTDHHELLIGPEEVKDNLKQIVWHLDEPNFNATAGAIFLLAQEAKKDVAVVLGGDGGDELFGGYPRYHYSRLLGQYYRIPLQVRQLLERVVSHGLAQKLTHRTSTERVLAFLALKPDLRREMLNPDKLENRIVHTHIEEYFSSRSLYSDDFEKQFMNFDRQSWLRDESLVRTDKMTMAFGLEERVPILDYRLVEYAYRIPTQWKLSLWQRPSNFQGKNIWRDAIKNYIPDHVLNEQKRGWFTPMAKWMRGELRETVEEYISPGHLNSEFFNTAEVQTLWKDHLEGKRYNLNSIWAIVMWQMWYDTFIKR